MGKEINPIKSNPTLKRQQFDKAFKLNAVALLKAGQKPATQLALELGIRRNLLYKWAETLVDFPQIHRQISMSDLLLFKLNWA